MVPPVSQREQESKMEKFVGAAGAVAGLFLVHTGWVKFEDFAVVALGWWFAKEFWDWVK